MRKIIKMLLKPSTGIRRIASEEPLFEGAGIFFLSVLIGNIELVSKFFISARAAIFNSFALVSLWLGALALGDAMVAGIIKLIHPASSRKLDTERVRKLVIVQMFISSILLFRPILSLFISIRLSWVLIFIWGATLVLIAVVSIWNIEEIKAAIAMTAGAVLIFVGAHFLAPGDPGVPSEHFNDFSGMIRELAEPAGISILSPLPEYGAVEFTEVRDYLIWFSQRRESIVSSYAKAGAGSLFLSQGMTGEAEEVYRELMNSPGLSVSLYRSVQMSLKDILTEEEFALLPRVFNGGEWRPVLKLWNIPYTLSGLGSEPGWIRVLHNIIFSWDTEELHPHMEDVLTSLRSSDYEDDIYYWLGQRFENEKDIDTAVEYYHAAINSANTVSEGRWEKEGLLEYADRKLGSPGILRVKYRLPYSMLAIGRIMIERGEYDSAVKKLLNASSEFPGHWAAGAALSYAAYASEASGDYARAERIYRRILSEYPERLFSRRAELMRRIVRDSSEELLDTYSSHLDKYIQGEREAAYKGFRLIIEDYPDSALAAELRISLSDSEYFTYDEAALYLSEARRNHPFSDRREYADTLLSGIILRKDGARAAADYLVLRAEYILEKTDRVPLNILRTAALYCVRAGDPAAAKDIYGIIIEKSASVSDVIRARFALAGLLEEEGKNSRALEEYLRIASEDKPRSYWSWRASQRISYLSEL